MEEVKVLVEAMEPKPQRTKSMRPLKSTIPTTNKIMSSKKTRKVTFTESNTNSTPKAKATNQNVTEDLATNAQTDQEEHNCEVANIRAEIARTELTKALSKAQNTLH